MSRKIFERAHTTSLSSHQKVNRYAGIKSIFQISSLTCLCYITPHWSAELKLHATTQSHDNSSNLPYNHIAYTLNGQSHLVDIFDFILVILVRVNDIPTHIQIVQIITIVTNRVSMLSPKPIYSILPLSLFDIFVNKLLLLIDRRSSKVSIGDSIDTLDYKNL